MRAVVYDRFGPPEVLRVEDVPVPEPKPGEVRVRIHATAVLKDDPGMRKTRGLNGLLSPKNHILGMDFAGEVESVGEGAARFSVGERVFGTAGTKLGTYAEFICMPEDAAIVPIPENLTFEQAAAIPDAAVTALPFLREKAELQPGQHVLVYGASGAVGTTAVQLVQALGGTVDGVCSTTNIELVQSLGAKHVYDYTKEDFTQSGNTWDVVFDAVGKCRLNKCRNAIRPGGAYITTVPNPGIFLRSVLGLKSGGIRVGFGAMGLRKPDLKRKDLELISTFIEEGKLRAVIDRMYTLEEMQEAHRYVETGRKKGSVVVTVHVVQ